jgi:hypothetical protein
MLAALCFRGEKLGNERIYRDQASVLVQLGVLNREKYPLLASRSPKRCSMRNLT